MRWPTILVWLFLPALIGVSVYGVRNLAVDLGPAAEVPEQIDIGSRERGHHVEVRIPVRNVGGRLLNMSRFETSCGSCGGHGRRTRDPLYGVTVAPGETYTALVAITVTGEPGVGLRRFVQFRTNDPRRPGIRVDLVGRVEGGLAAVPPALDVGQAEPPAIGDPDNRNPRYGSGDVCNPYPC